MRRSLSFLITLAAFLGVTHVHAQVLDHPITVPVQFMGEFEATYDTWFYGDWPYQAEFELSLASGSASGYAYDGGSYETSSGTAQMRPGKDYEMTIYGNGIDDYKVHFDPPPGYRVVVQDEVRRAYDPGYDPLWGWSTYLKIRLEGGDAVSYMPAGDSTGLNPNRTVWQVGLGRLSNGKGAGSIGLREDGISGVLGTRDALFYDSACPEVEIIYVSGTTKLRQIYSLQALVNITDETGGLQLSFYPRASYTKVSGLYDVSGATAFVSFLLTKNSSTQFTITKTIGSKSWYTRVDKPDATHWNLIDWTEDLNAPVRKEERVYSTSAPYTYEDITVKDGSNTVATVTRRVFQDFGSGWGKELVQETRGYGTVGQISTFEYHTSAGSPGNYRKLKRVVRPDDSWVQFSYHDSLAERGMLAATYEPFQDSPTSAQTPTTGNCRYTTFGYSADHYDKNTRLALRQEWTNGALTGKTVVTYQTPDPTVGGLPVVVATRKDYSDPSTYRQTITHTYREDADSTDHWYPELPRMVETASGQRTVYAYVRGWFDPSLRTFTPNPGDVHVAEVIIHGSNSSAGNVTMSMWGGQTIETVYVVPNKSWMEMNIRTNAGVVIYRANHVANGSGAFVRTNGLLMPHTNGRYIQYQYDDYGRYHNQWTWEYGRIKQHTDENGVVTEFGHDNYGRVTERKRVAMAADGGYPAVPELVVNFEYDADHRLRYRKEGPSPRPTYEWQYDQAGRLVSSNEPGLAATTVSYPNPREVKYELPGPYMVGDTETTSPKRYYLEERWRDGSFKRRTGNAAPPAYSHLYLDNGNPAHGRILRHAKRSESTTDEWKNVWFDWLGRVTQAFEPTYLEDANPNAINVLNFYYCGCGRLERTTHESNAFGTIGAPTKYDYDAMGNLKLRVIDIDQDNTIDYGDRDRIEKHDTSFQEISSAWWLVEKVSTYPKAGYADERRVSEVRTKLSGFTSGQVAVVQRFDAPGNMTQTIVRVETSGKRRFQEVTAPDSSTTAQTIWVNGRLWKETSATGVVATYEYDDNDRVTKIQGRQDVKERFSYYSGSYLVYQKLNHFFATDTFEYDSAGRVKVHTDAVGKVVRFAYDAMGNLTHRWGQTTQPVKFQYDANGRRTYMWTYQGGSNWNSTSWPSGTTGTANQTYWDYQEKTGLLIEKQDPAGRWVKYEYNVRHQVSKRTEQRATGYSLVTNYVYWENQDSSSPSYWTGELKTVDYTDSNTVDLQFQYDRLGRTKKVSDATVYPSEPWREFFYQDDDPNAGAGHYANLQVEKEILSPGFYPSQEIRRRFQTGVKGRYEGFDYGPSSSVTHGNTYQFDSGTGRVSTLTSTSGPDWSYGYLSGSDLVQTVTAGSTWQRTNYWQGWRNLLDGNSHVYGGSATKASHWSNTDWLGRRLDVWLTGELPLKFNSSYTLGTLTDFEYTDRSEVKNTNAYPVTGIAYPVPNVGSAITGRYREWTYDTAMNRAEQWTSGAPGSTSPNSTYTRNNLDQITAITGDGAATLTHDWAGNLGDDGTWIYYYDAESRPYRMSHKSQNLSLFFTYDYLGRRVQKRVGYYDDGWEWTSETKYVYDGWNLVAETNSSGTVIRTYTWGLDASSSLQGAGGVGGLLHFRQDGVNYIPIYDPSHNIVGWSRQSDGAIMSATAYSPFGEVLQHWEDSGFTGKAKFGFSTKYTDSETALVYYGYRYYHPKLGRFINRDPIGEAGGINLYALVGNNPINKTDLLGLRWVFDVTGYETDCEFRWDWDSEGQYIYGYFCEPNERKVWGWIWVPEAGEGDEPDSPMPEEGPGRGGRGAGPQTSPESEDGGKSPDCAPRAGDIRNYVVTKAERTFDRQTDEEFLREQRILAATIGTLAVAGTQAPLPTPPYPINPSASVAVVQAGAAELAGTLGLSGYQNLVSEYVGAPGIEEVVDGLVATVRHNWEFRKFMMSQSPVEFRVSVSYEVYQKDGQWGKVHDERTFVAEKGLSWAAAVDAIGRAAYKHYAPKGNDCNELAQP